MNQNRKGQRSNVLMHAQIEIGGKSRDVKLRNLSTEGALVEGENLPVEGSTVMFRKGDIKAPATIAWVSHHRAGVRFDHPLAKEMLLRHVPRPRAKSPPKFEGRPPIRSTELSPADRLASENWVWSDPIERFKR